MAALALQLRPCKMRMKLRKELRPRLDKKRTSRSGHLETWLTSAAAFASAAEGKRIVDVVLQRYGDGNTCDVICFPWSCSTHQFQRSEAASVACLPIA
jgi:hypothetical protein